MFHSLIPFNRDRARPATVETADPFFRLHEDVNRLFEDAFRSFGSLSPYSGFSGDGGVRVDMREKGDALIVEAELPGVAEDDLDVEATETAVIIRGEKKFEETKEDAGGWRVSERAYGAFARSLPLPVEIDADRAEAAFRNGVLTLTLPKSAKARESVRKLAIRKG